MDLTSSLIDRCFPIFVPPDSAQSALLGVAWDGWQMKPFLLYRSSIFISSIMFCHIQYCKSLLTIFHKAYSNHPVVCTEPVALSGMSSWFIQVLQRRGISYGQAELTGINKCWRHYGLGCKYREGIGKCHKQETGPLYQLSDRRWLQEGDSGTSRLPAQLDMLGLWPS